MKEIVIVAMTIFISIIGFSGCAGNNVIYRVDRNITDSCDNMSLVKGMLDDMNEKGIIKYK